MQEIPRYDTEGREWCFQCQEYLYVGHLHKGTPEHKEISHKALEEGMCFDGIQRHATNPSLNMSPAYMQDCITDLQKRIITLENFIGQNYPKDISALKGFYAEYGHRLLNIENAFTEEDIAIKPSTLMDEIKRCNKHIEKLNKRIDQVEKMTKDPFRHGEKNMPDPDILATVLEQLNNIKQRYGKDDGLSPEAFGVLLLRIEKLERLADTINAHQKGAEDFVKKVSNELGQDLGIYIERIEKLEERLLSPEHVANNFSQIIDKVLEPNITSLHKRIDELEQRAIKRIGILGNAVNELSEENVKLRLYPYKYCFECGKKHE